MERDDGGLSVLDDAGTFVEFLMGKPELLPEDVLVIGEARDAETDAPGGRLAIAWRHEGGAALLGVTTGSGSEALLVETIGFLARTEDWPLVRWSESVGRYWERAPVELRNRMAKRWGISLDTAWSVASWTRAAWGEEPIEGKTAIALVATQIPPGIEAVVEWLARYQPAAAFRIRWYDEDATPGPRFDRVAGSWGGEPEAPGDPAAILAVLEKRCLDAGCRVARRAAEWVRFDGNGRSVRAFPGPAWVDLQLVGIDEGTRIGLGYRFGVSLAREAPPDAPPGVHLRLVGSGLDPAVGALVDAWLGGTAAGPAVSAAPRTGGGRSRKPRNASRRKDPG